jgi:uncharacterized protein (TIGR03435 family)
MKPSPALPPDFPLETAAPRPLKFGVDKDGFAIIPSGQANILAFPSRDGQTRLSVACETIEVLCSYLSHRMQQPIVDRTGLKGIYDFHLAFATDSVSPATSPPSPDGRDLSAATPEASDPAPTLIKAVNQLGLKMEAKSLSVDVLIIDHAEKRPTEN